MIYCLLESSWWLQLPNNISQQWVNIALVIHPHWNLVIRELCDRRHAMSIWCMICWCTWTPGVKEQDKLNPRQLSEGQAVSANRCIRGRADGQGQCVSRGAGDCSAPAGIVNNSRQTKDSPGSILLGRLGTCVEQGKIDTDYIRVKHLLPGKMVTPFFPKPRLNLALTFLEYYAEHGKHLRGTLSYYIIIIFSPEGVPLGQVLSLALHVFPVGKHHILWKQLAGHILFCKLVQIPPENC